MTQSIDKTDVAIFGIFFTILAVILLALAYTTGAASVENTYRKEAIERNFAYYAVDSSGKTEFRWKAPARFQDGIDSNSLVRISL